MSVLDMTRPRVFLAPESTSSAGQEAVELARMAGLELDPWQALVLEHALAEKADGKWAAFEVGVNVPRQNGKGSILEARELAALFLLGERLTIHSAHQFDTSLEAFRRLLFLVEETPELSRRVKRVSRAHGEEGIELMNGQRIRFRTRTKGGGRGFTADCLILDEAMILPETAHGALLPTLAARPNPQVWYTGSAVDQLVHQDGIVWARVRERGHSGQEEGLAYFEWSADAQNPSEVTAEMAGDPDAWAVANPGLGIRISADHIEKERLSMDPRTFAVERLGVGDWPSTDPGGASVIDVHRWRTLIDPHSQIDDTVAFSFDVTPDRSSASVCAAGRRADGLMHVEVIDHRSGTGWVVDRLVELHGRHAPRSVVCDGGSPAATLADELSARGVVVDLLNTTDYVRACGTFFDLVAEGGIRHLGSGELDSAIRGAATRPLSDAWAWSRKTSAVDISPLVAVTIAAAAIAANNPTPFFI